MGQEFLSLRKSVQWPVGEGYAVSLLQCPELRPGAWGSGSAERVNLQPAAQDQRPPYLRLAHSLPPQGGAALGLQGRDSRVEARSRAQATRGKGGASGRLCPGISGYTRPGYTESSSHPGSPDSQKNGLGPQGVLPSGLGFGTKVLARLLSG